MATYYASGATWNTASNWGLTTGASDGAVPTITDDVIFDANSISMALDVNIAFATMNTTGFTGTLTQGAYTIHCDGADFNWQAGTFAGGSGDITVDNDWTQSGGTFTNTSGIMNFTKGSISYMTRTAGVYNHNNGTIETTGNHFEIDMGGADLFNCHSNFSNPSTYWTFANPNDVIRGGFTQDRGAFSAGLVMIDIHGSYKCCSNQSNTSGLTFNYVGTGDQEFYFDKAGGAPLCGGGVRVNKPSGTFTFYDDIGVRSNTGATCLEWVKGAVAFDSSFVKFGDRGYHSLVSWTSPVILPKFYVYKHNSNTSINLIGDLNINDFTNAGVGALVTGAYSINIHGNAVQNNDMTGSEATVKFVGTGLQTFNPGGHSFGDNDIVIDKPSGDVRMTGPLSQDYSGSNLIVTNGTIDFNGQDARARNMTVDGGSVLGGSGDIIIDEVLAVNGGSVTSTSGTLTCEEFDKTGGTWNPNNGKLIIGRYLKSTIVKESFYDVECTLGVSDLVLAADISIANSLDVDSAVNLGTTYLGGDIYFETGADLTTNGSFNHNAGTILVFEGNNTWTQSATSTALESLVNNITINGNLTLINGVADALWVFNQIRWNAGTFDCSTASIGFDADSPHSQWWLLNDLTCNKLFKANGQYDLYLYDKDGANSKKIITGDVDMNGGTGPSVDFHVGSIEFSGNWIQRNTAKSAGNGTIKAVGPNIQSIQCPDGGALFGSSFTTEKTGGRISLASDLDITSKDFSVNDGYMSTAGFTLTVKDLVIGAEGRLYNQTGTIVATTTTGTVLTTVAKYENTWVGPGSGTVAGNWALNRVPVLGDVVSFNSISNDCDFNITVDMDEVIIDSVFSNTVTQTANVDLILGDFTQSGGTWDCNGYDLFAGNLNDTFRLNPGATFIEGSGIVRAIMNVVNNAGTYITSGGLFYQLGPGSIEGTASFGNVKLYSTNNQHKTLNSDLTILGDLELTAQATKGWGFNGAGMITCHGNVKCTERVGSNNINVWLEMVGEDKKLYVDEAGGVMNCPSLKLNAPTGTITIKDTLTMNGFCHAQGTVVCDSSSTIKLNGAFSTDSIWEFESPGLTLNNLEFFTGTSNRHFNLIGAQKNNINVEGAITYGLGSYIFGVGGGSGGLCNVKGDVICTGTGISGSHATNLVGTGVQAWSAATVTASAPGPVTVNKVAGLVSMASDLNTGYDLDINDGFFSTEGFTLTVDDLVIDSKARLYNETGTIVATTTTGTIRTDASKIENTWFGPGNFTDTTKWAMERVPNSSDIMTFNIASDVGNWNVTSTIADVIFCPDFASTITQTAAITVNRFYQYGGSFVGGSDQIYATSIFDLQGGSFTSTTGNLRLNGTSTRNPAAIFIHNSGTVYVTSNGTSDLNSANLWDLWVSLSTNRSTTFSSDVNVLNDLKTSGGRHGINGANILVYGNIYSDVTLAGGSSSATVKAVGSDDAFIGHPDGSTFASYGFNLSIEKTGGTTTLNGGDLHTKNFAHISGTVDANGGSVNVAQDGSIQAGSMTFYRVGLSAGTNKSMSVNSDITVANRLLVSGGGFSIHGASNTIYLYGDLETSCTEGREGSALIKMVGPADATMGHTDGTSISYTQAKLEIAKDPTATVTFADSTHYTGNYLLYTSGIVDAGLSTYSYGDDGTLDVDGMSFYNFSTNGGTNHSLNYNSDVNIINDLTIGGGGYSDNSVGGSWTVSFGGNLITTKSAYKSSPIDYRAAGTGTQVFTSNGSFGCKDFIVDKASDEFRLDSAISVATDVDIQNGTLSLNGLNITVGGKLGGAGTLKMKGNETITYGSLDTSIGTVEYFDSAVATTVSAFATSFYRLVLGRGKTHYFTIGTMHTINNLIGSNGIKGTPARLKSTIQGTKWLLKLEGESSVRDTASVEDCDARPGKWFEAVGSEYLGSNYRCIEKPLRSGY